jgi:hypothetical protein
MPVAGVMGRGTPVAGDAVRVAGAPLVPTSLVVLPAGVLVPGTGVAARTAGGGLTTTGPLPLPLVVGDDGGVANMIIVAFAPAEGPSCLPVLGQNFVLSACAWPQWAHFISAKRHLRGAKASSIAGKVRPVRRNGATLDAARRDRAPLPGTLAGSSS